MSLLRIPSLRWRLVLVMCAAYIVVAAIILAVSYFQQKRSLQQQLNARAQTNATILAAGVVVPVSGTGPLNKPALQIFVTSIATKQSGVNYADVRTGPPRCKVVAHSPPIAGVPRGCRQFNSVSGPTHETLPGGNVLGVAPIFSAGNPLVGYAVVIVSNRSIQSALSTNLTQDVLALALGLVIFFVLSLLIAQYILGPLSDLARAAIALRRGQLFARVPATGETELTAVGGAFNEMADALETRIKHLSFLARSGAELPTTLRQRESVEPLLHEFGQVLRATAAGLTSTESEVLWCGVDEQRCRAAIKQIERRTSPGIEEHDGLIIMAVPVPGDALFVTVRDASEPFTDEEQQVIANFAYQIGIAADNVQLFDAQQEALQVKDQFLSIVSHELRTPLTTMKGYAQMLRRRLVDDPEAQRFAGSIDAQVTRLSRLVDDLLDVTRFSRGQFELSRRNVDLRPILEDTVSRFRVISEHHTLRLELDGDHYIGYWDRDRLEQVLNNLISNAIKYSPDGGTVTIGARQEDGRAVVFVRDEGIGIPEEDLEHLFERFYRGSNETQGIKGLGLGLYVTQRVVDAHGGEVRVTSTQGEGSEFSFTLPLAESAEPVTP
jgi:signal transduction histidine kinase